MANHPTSKFLVLLIILVALNTTFIPLLSSKNVVYHNVKRSDMFDGQILFAPYEGTTTYLINSTGVVNHTWPSTYLPFFEAYWLGNGTILRPYTYCGLLYGGIQIINWDGSLSWNWQYVESGCTTHHDVKVLPNGNILMIVWVSITRDQAIAAGRNPNTIGNTLQSDKIIEVHPTGPTTGTIVWEWQVWDHLIQDYDSSKANYGVVGEHPELIDINFGDSFVGDWLHTNSLDYNATFDQILVDSHNFDEVWVIDHNTTTEEAAGHTGGHYDHGGDLLYRWGNPQAYRAGNASDQKLFGQHGASWIKAGYPGAGDILFFNNGYNRPNEQYSTVDEFTPPIDVNGNYSFEPGTSYGPTNFTWEYKATPPASMYSQDFGGANRLKDGNTLICTGMQGKFLEVTPQGDVIWQWTNPYPSPNSNAVYKIDYIEPHTQPQPPENTTNISCTISGGIGAHATLKNIGVVNATNIEWQIHVTGGILKRIKLSKNGVCNLPIGASTTVATDRFFGLGPITITVQVGNTTKQAQGTQFFIYTIIKS